MFQVRLQPMYVYCVCRSVCVCFCECVRVFARVYKVQVSVYVESVSEQGHFRSSSRCPMIYSRIYRQYTRWVNEKVDKVH